MGVITELSEVVSEEGSVGMETVVEIQEDSMVDSMETMVDSTVTMVDSMETMGDSTVAMVDSMETMVDPVGSLVYSRVGRLLRTRIVSSLEGNSYVVLFC